MHRLNEIASKLTPAQVKELEDFGEFLLSRKQLAATVVRDGEEYLNVNAFAGMLAEMAPDRTAVELVHESNAAMAAKYADRVK